MKEFIRESLRENFVGKDISVKYLKQLLNLINNRLAIKYVNGWINRANGSEMVSLSAKEITLFNLIKSGGIIPQNFSTKN
jgi:hypothetical protein